MAQPPVVLHIGYMKTGTTTLQKDFFPRMSDCTFVTYRGPAADHVYDNLAQNLRHASDEDFLEDTLRSYLVEATERGDGPLLVSDEMLAGDIWKHHSNPEMVAERLHRVRPDARVLITVRNQGARLRSHYSLYVKNGGYESFGQYLEQASPRHEIDLRRFEYDHLVAHYQQVFGPDQVKVVAYERLRADPNEFLDDLAAWIPHRIPESVDIDALPFNNRALSAPSRRVLRETNRLFRRSRYNSHPRIMRIRSAGRLRRTLEHLDQRLLARATTSMRPADVDRLAEVLPRFEASNVRLSALTGLPLHDLGYPYPPESAAR